MPLTRRLLGGSLAFATVPALVFAQGAPCASHTPALLGAQTTFIGQRLEPFQSPYSGTMSLKSDGDRQLSHSYGVYGGACILDGLDVYLDIEMIRGAGISHASGVAAVTNGDVLRQGSVDLGPGPYVARAFLRWTRTYGGAERDTIARAMDALPRVLPARRLEIRAGKLAATDMFDLNRYANSTRSQFLDWVLFNNGAWDYAADTRGYSNGVAAAWITPSWTLRAGSFQMPTFANGNKFDNDLSNARGDNVELTVAAPGGAVVRALAYLNHGRMGRYAEVTASAAAQHRVPDIVADDAAGRTKYGFGLNAELPIADQGETGAFARLGWSDGRNESFVFTESDQHVSAGLQLAGARWGRTADHIGIAVAADALSSAHRDYLAAGGVGFLLGDGRLAYGSEQLLEAYYRLQIGRFVQVSPDIQHIRNPGYNRDRGPATVLGLRANVHF